MNKSTERPLLRKQISFPDLNDPGQITIEQLGGVDNLTDSIIGMGLGPASLQERSKVHYRDPFEVVVGNLPHRVFLKNVDSVYLTCNRRFADFLGREPEDIIGKTDLELVPEELALQIRYEDQLTLEQGVPRHYIQEVCKDGQKLLMQVTKMPVQGKKGKNLGLLGILVEISDVMTIKGFLENGKLKAELMVEDNQDVFYKIDFRGTDNFLSNNIHRLTGYSAREFMQLSHSRQFAPGSLGIVEELMDFYRQGAKSVNPQAARKGFYRKVDLEMNRKDGGTIWVESVNNLYFNSLGEVSGIIGIYRNIQDRKTLEFRVKETLEKMQRLSEAQAQIISIISHEFKTPISILNSNLQILEQHRNNLDDKILDDTFDLSAEAIKALTHTLNNINLLAKNRKGALKVSVKSLDLEPFLLQLIRELECIPEYAGRIEYSSAFGLGTYRLDPVLLKHVLDNLLVNGLKYSPADRKVILQVLAEPGMLHFRIQDEGIGIPAEELDRVFESFYRASNAQGYRGSGLGLAIVKECMNLLEGTIRVSSQSGVGTAMEITLPVNVE